MGLSSGRQAAVGFDGDIGAAIGHRNVIAEGPAGAFGGVAGHDRVAVHGTDGLGPAAAGGIIAAAGQRRAVIDYISHLVKIQYKIPVLKGPEVNHCLDFGFGFGGIAFEFVPVGRIGRIRLIFPTRAEITVQIHPIRIVLPIGEAAVRLNHLDAVGVHHRNDIEDGILQDILVLAAGKALGIVLNHLHDDLSVQILPRMNGTGDIHLVRRIHAAEYNIRDDQTLLRISGDITGNIIRVDRAERQRVQAHLRVGVGAAHLHDIVRIHTLEHIDRGGICAGACLGGECRCFRRYCQKHCRYQQPYRLFQFRALLPC